MTRAEPARSKGLNAREVISYAEHPFAILRKLQQEEVLRDVERALGRAPEEDP